MSLRTSSVAAPVLSAEGTVVAAVGLVTTTARRDLTGWLLQCRSLPQASGGGPDRPAGDPGATGA